MDCITTNVTIKGDPKGILKRLVNDITLRKNNDSVKRALFVSYLNDDEFLQWVKNYKDKKGNRPYQNIQSLNEDESPYFNIKQNRTQILGKLLNEYYRRKHPNVNNYIIEDKKDKKEGFSSSNARSLAIEHTANIVLNIIAETTNESERKKINSLETIDKVSDKLKEEFDSVVRQLMNRIAEDKTSSEEEKAAVKALIKAENEYNNLFDRYDELVDKEENEELTEEEEDELNELDELIDLKRSALYSRKTDLIDRFGSPIEKNWRMIMNMLATQRSHWFTEVFRHNKLYNIRKEFEEVLENDKIENYNPEDDLDNENTETTDVDEMSKSWIDNIPTSYTKTVGARVKLYLSSLYNLKSKGSKNSDVYDFDTVNELGVKTTMDVNTLISAITTLGRFYSINEFKESIYELSQLSKEYYGLIQLYNKMNSNPNFAFEIMTELANPKINKTMAIMQGAIASFRWSNVASDHRSKMLFDLMNTLQFLYRSNFDENHYKILDEINSETIDIQDKDQKLINLFRTYFPIINIEDILKYLKEDDRNYSTFINNLRGVIDAAKETKAKFIDEQVRASKEGNFNVNNIDFTKLNLAAINTANLLYNYTNINVELNSANAQGNMSSDLIKNSYLTNLMKQIYYSNSKDGEFAGLRKLKEFISQGEQYKHSPIFWGIRDKDGILMPGGDGLFYRKSDRKDSDINPNAKKLIAISLFDGTKNNDEVTAAMYESMGKNDYMITQLLAFNNPIKHQRILEDENEVKDTHFKSNYAGYFMRTPSDAPRNYIIQMRKYSTDGLFNKNGEVNNRNLLYNAIRNQVLNELNLFITQLNNVFVTDNGQLISKEKTDGLIDIFHYNKQIVKNGKLTGNLFSFAKLFTTNGYNAGEELINELSLYGENNPLFLKDGDKLIINTKRTDLIEIKDSVISLKLNKAIQDVIDKVLSEWFKNYLEDITKEYNLQKESLKQLGISLNNFINYAFNTANAYYTFDDLFEGDSKIYKNARDFLKRAKEVQAGGKVYSAFDLNDYIGGSLQDVKINESVDSSYTILDNINGIPFTVPRYINNKIKESPFTLRNGFRAITIHNTVVSNTYLQGKIKLELTEILSERLDEEIAEQIAYNIAKGYGEPTAVNDAQSYITLEEFIARRAADGTLDKYKDLVTQLLDPNVNIEDIDIEKVNDLIQVQKNFYFDKVYDEQTHTFYTRQIKNAEFVLIPKLIKGTDLERVYNFMRKNDIGQINTKETSKAGRRNIMTIWDNEGNLVENFEENYSEAFSENYYYRYLYKQQDVPQHMKDATNKAGIQIMKKIIDNAMTSPDEEVQKHVKTFFEAYVANIKESYMNFLDKMGWALDSETRTIRDKKNTNLTFKEFYKIARREASRLGLDENFLDYFTEDPITNEPIMPNFLNLASVKQESIAQSLFNSAITRQTLSGWHGAQVTSVGHGAKILNSDGKFRKLQYHPEVKDKDGNIIKEAYAEIMIPRWSKLIPKNYPIEKLEEEELDLQIAYRIPTEGKQSIALVKVVGFLDDIYGSTVMVPDEWVIQTGSDFDVDSIYAIHHQLYKDADGNIKKVEFDKDDSPEAVQRRYISRIKALSKEIIDRETVTEEDIDEATKNIKDRLNNSLKVFHNQIYENFKELLNVFDEEDSDREAIIELIKRTGTQKEKYENILNQIQTIISNINDDERKTRLMIFAIRLHHLLNVIDENDNIRQELIDGYKNEKYQIIKKLFDEAFNKYFEEYKKIAKEYNLISFEEFKKLSIVEQNSKSKRTAQIVDSMIAIMKSENSREENYSRSNFDELTREMEYCDYLRGAKAKSESTYNPFDQLKYMENARSGASLKAFSVTRDTFLSINNKVQTHIPTPIIVEYDLDETIKVKKGDVWEDEKDEKGNIIHKYNEKLIIEAYGEENVKKVDNKLIVKHRTFGWSSNNRNVRGMLVTPYSSQTTAHILDAIKTGSIFNENKFTFGTFKTLIDLGIDYGTAIAFLMQPAITTINAFNGNKESVYNSSFAIPIKDTLIKLLNDFGIRTKEGKLLTSYIKDDAIYSIIKNDIEIKQGLKELFNIEKLNVTEIPLRGDLLRLRLQNEKLYDGTLSKEKYDIIFDIATTLFFENVNAITKNIEKLARCCNPDKFGAKQTIYETKQVLDNIERFSKNESDIGNTLRTKDKIKDENGNENEKNLLQVIYPNLLKTEDDIKKSVYPYLAAFLKYSTITSAAINSELFIIEKNIDTYLNIIKNSLGISLSNEQYLNFKKYLVSQIFAGVSVFTTPLTVNEDNYIIEDIELAKEFEKLNVNFWNTERARILGYDVIQLGNFEIEDFENPTEEELMKFKKLTVAQKVIKIRELFGDDAGIFKYLIVNLYNQREVSNKGYSNQTVTVNELMVDKNVLLKEFSNSFYNENILIRLATIDLIKYAFVAEQFNFKKGAISKIIPNIILYGDRTDYNLGVIDNIKDQKNNVLNNENINDILNYIEKFVRSHRELVKLIKLNDEQFKKFITLNIDSRLIYIDITKDKSILSLLRLDDAEYTKKYIRVGNYKGIDDLYRIKYVRDSDGNVISLYLIPLNYLEYNETDDVSINNRNNKFLHVGYYETVIRENNFKNKELQAIYTIQKRNYDNAIKNTEDPNFLINNTNTGNQKDDAAVKHFINQIKKIVDDNFPVEKSYFTNPYPLFKQLFKDDKTPIIQNIEIETTDENNNVTKKIIQVKITRKEITKPIKTVRYIISKVENTEDIKEFNEILNETEEKRKSILNEFEDTSDIEDIKRDEFDEIAIQLYNEFVKQTSKYDDEQASLAIHNLKEQGLSIVSNKSIRTHNKSIYTNAAQYYSRKAEDLLYQIEHFKSVDGEEYDISDKELYVNLSKHPEDYVNLVRLLLDAKTLGESFAGIFNLHLDQNVDEETKHAIKIIKKSIDDIRKNTKIKKGFELMFNVYIANEYSTNPLIRQNIIKLRTQFGDTDYSDMFISDIGHLNNKEIQTVVKMVYSIINEATQFVAPKLVDEFTKKYNDILNSPGEYNQNNIIDKYSRLILPYTEEFKIDNEKHAKAVIDAKKSGEYSLDYVKAKLEYDKWRLKNTHRQLINDYYERDIAMREEVLDKAQDLYLKYLELINELYSDNRNVSLLSEDEKRERKILKDKIKSLSSEFNSDGTLKSEEEIEKATALKEYIRKHRELNTEYYDYRYTKEFNSTLRKHLTTKQRYENEHPNETLSQRLLDSTYREAYEWINYNTYKILDDKTQKAVNNAFAILKNPDNTTSREVQQILLSKNAYDDFGTINPMKLSIEDLMKIKEIYSRKYENMVDENGSDIFLISNAEQTIPTQEAKDKLKALFGDVERVNDEQRNKYITRINELLVKAKSSDGKIHTQELFTNLTKTELEELAKLYEKLRIRNQFLKDTRDPSGLTIEQLEEYKSIVHKKINYDSFNEELKYFEDNIKGTENELLWLKIFGIYEDGKILTKDKSKTDKTQVYFPNEMIFSGNIYTKNYRDFEKEKASEFIKNHVRFVPTEYYYEAEKNAKINGTYGEWYYLNHIYNPLTHEYEPLKIWTTMEVNESEEYPAKYSYAPTFDNSERKIKEEYKNKNYNNVGSNYNYETGEYNNLKHLSEKELRMVNLLRETLQTHAFTKRAKKFINAGFLPRRYKTQTDYKWYANQLLGMAGFNFSHTGENRYSDDFDYTNDTDVEIPLLDIIKGIGYKELEKLDSQYEGEEDASFEIRKEINRKINEERTIDNLKIEEAIIDKDWLSVFKEFITKAVEANAREKAKNNLYLLIEELKENDAIKYNTFTGDVKRTKKGTTEEQQAYVTEKQKNALNVTKTFGRRLINKEFKENNPLSKWADLLQNVTSAKYMVFNVTGGIANIGTGFVNILGEAFAEDFFNKTELGAGIAKYLGASVNFLADMYKEKSNNFTVALTKFFDVVDLNAMQERRTDETAAQYAKRMRDLLYSLQSGGEHYMQNAILFAMLKSHRLFKDVDGTLRIGSLSNYIWNIELESMKKTLEFDSDMYNSYKNFVHSIKTDYFKLEKYDTFKRDINEDFLRERGNKELIKKYISIKKEAIKKAKIEFNNDSLHPTLESQLELIDGRVNIKPESEITEKMILEFREKVIYANKKIHGVYDKLGAAGIEKLWWGGLVMQYHKHIYPGIMKRFRIKGYYNELTQNVEVGSYITLVKFLATEFRDITNKVKDSNENIALASIQEVCKALINTILNVNVNYHLMPEWEKRNLRRVLGDLYGIISAMLAGILLYALTDDDELEDSELLSLCLYMSDRLLSEAQMYTPWGAVSEASTLWSSPIAAGNSLKDGVKAISLLTQYLYDDDFNVNYTTGLYKGENKFVVLAYRNTPAWRVYKRLTNMSRNNSYYRLNESSINIKLTKNIADMINPD